MMMLEIATATMMMAPMASSDGDVSDAGEMLPLLKRHEIQVLLSVDMPLTKIAERVGVSVATVKRVRKESSVEHADDAAEHRRRGIGRPSKAARFTERVQTWLAEDALLPTQELLRRALAEGYDGHKSAFYSLVSAHRPSRATPLVRFEGLPGEFSQHDFGEVDVRFVDGRKKRVRFFASRLKYSRFCAVTLVDNQRTETLVRTLVRHFIEFGGVPLLAVFDRPRTIVTKSGRGRKVEQFNDTFAQVMLELGVGVEMCAPRSGWQKGTVEQLVKWVKNSFFKWRKFIDEEDLETQLAGWVREVNFETPNRATAVFPETRRREELERLRPVRVLPDELALRVPIFVGMTAEVMFEGIPYSMPPSAANVPGTAFVYANRIRFVAGRHEVEHARRKQGDPPATLPEHRAQKLAAVHEGRSRNYEMREQVLRLGDDALTLLTAIVHRSPQRAHESIAVLHALLGEHGEGAMRDALAHATAAGELTARAVREFLEPSTVLAAEPVNAKQTARSTKRGTSSKAAVRVRPRSKR
jgi:transposase